MVSTLRPAATASVAISTLNHCSLDARASVYAANTAKLINKLCVMRDLKTYGSALVPPIHDD